MKKQLLAVLITFAAGIIFAEPIQVSVTGTAETTEMGYTLGQSYTFNWVINGDFDGGASDSFESNENKWRSLELTEKMIFSSFSGDGLVGTYTRPNLYNTAGDHQMNAINTGLGFGVRKFGTATSMGLTVNGVKVDGGWAGSLKIPNLDYSDTSFVNPETYLSGYTGTYAQTDLNNQNMYISDDNGNTINFTPTSVTIGAVPEPATIGLLLFGLGGLRILKRFYGK